LKVTRDTNPALFFSKKEKVKIVEAIQRAEMKTSGEIRVHLERRLAGDPLEHAWKIFQKLKMNQTEERCGVLILMGLKSKRFFVLGDEGIHKNVSSDFWQSVTDKMMVLFKEDRFADGLVEGIDEIGNQLMHFFPYQRDDINELPDEISYSL
jgi:uncharacterized membrane protein